MTPATPLLHRVNDTGIPLTAARLVLGGLFLYMGISKALDPITFLKVVRQYEALPLNPPHLLNGVAIVLPWLEIVCGGALILNLWRRGSSVLVAFMLCVFTPAIFLRAMNIHQTEGTPFFQIKFDCGCGAGEVVIWKKLLENTVLLSVAVLALVSTSRPLSLLPLTAPHAAAPARCKRCGAPVSDAPNIFCRVCRNREDVRDAA